MEGKIKWKVGREGEDKRSREREEIMGRKERGKVREREEGREERRRGGARERSVEEGEVCVPSLKICQGIDILDLWNVSSRVWERKCGG